MKLKENNGSAKIIVIVAIIVVLLIVGIIFKIINSKKDKVVETIKEDPYEYFTVYSQDEKVGVIDKNGNQIIESKYSNIYVPNQSKPVFFCFVNDNEYSIFDNTGKDIFTNFANVMPITISDTTLEMEKQVLSYEKDGKFGLVDFEGNKLTDAIYDEVSSLQNKPGCILVEKDGLCGVLDSKGNTIIDIKYNSVKGDEYCSEKDQYLKTGYIISEKTNSGIIYGYIDYNGKVIIEPKYESIVRALEYEEDDIYLIFMDSGKKGVIKNNKTTIKPKYRSINYYNSSKVFVVNRNGKYGFFDADGSEIIAPEYEAYSIAGNYISVRLSGKSMLYDLHGNLVNTNTYKSILETGNPSYFIAQDEDGYFSIISKDMQIDDKYTNMAYAFGNFFIFGNEDGKSGVLNVYTGVEIPAEYDYIILLENAKCLEARKGNEVDIYSENLEKVLTMSEGIVEKVSDDFVSVYSKSELNYIDSKGNLVQNTEVFKNLNLYSFKSEDGKWGFKDKDGNVKVNPEFDIVTELNEYGFASVCKDNKWGVINKEGEVIVEPSYEIESYYAPSFIGKYLLEEHETIYCTEVK